MKRNILPIGAVAALAVLVAVVSALLDWPASATYAVLALAMFVFVLVVGPLVLAVPPHDGNGKPSLVDYLIGRVRGDYEMRLPSGSVTSTPAAPPPSREGQ